MALPLTLAVLELIAVPPGCMANIIPCDNEHAEYPVGFVTLGSRRFSISLEISVAEILIVIDFVSQSSFRIESRLTRWLSY